jgi:hypothetical protein
MLTYNWVRGLDHPTPNFNTEHKCRDFESILSWSKDHKQELDHAKIADDGKIVLDHLP